MRFLTVSQPAVATCRCRGCLLFLGALLVQVSAPAPQTAGWLLAVCSYVAKLLVVVTLRKGTLIPVRLHPYSDVAEAW
jgi:hypothetical protein